MYEYKFANRSIDKPRCAKLTLGSKVTTQQGVTLSAWSGRISKCVLAA